MSQIQVSQLDDQGAFVGVGIADESPLEPGVFLIPRGAIAVDPPEVPEGKVALWRDEAWVFADLPSSAEIGNGPGALVPDEVTMRQARLALLGDGLLDRVEAAIENLPPQQRAAARIEWEYAQVVRRVDPLVQYLAPELELDDVALDRLFTIAGAL